MSSNYPDFSEQYIDETPHLPDVGYDSPNFHEVIVVNPPATVQGPIQMTGTLTGGPGGGGGGGGIIWNPVSGGQIISIPAVPPDEIAWIDLVNITLDFSVYGLLLHPETKKILTYKGKLLENFSKKYSWIIQAGMYGRESSHLRCIVLDYTVDGVYYYVNAVAAIKAFFEKGFLAENDVSTSMNIGTKWQRGHYPLSINSIFLKIIDSQKNEETVEHIGLTMNFRKTATLTMTNRKISFTK